MARTSWPGGGRLRIVPASAPDYCGLLHGACFLRPGHRGECADLWTIWKRLDDLEAALASATQFPPLHISLETKGDTR